jgi:hypothetical protein
MELARQSGLQQGSARTQSSTNWLQVPGLPVWRQPLLVLAQQLSVQPAFSQLVFSPQQVWPLQFWPQV